MSLILTAKRDKNTHIWLQSRPSGQQSPVIDGLDVQQFPGPGYRRWYGERESRRK